MKTFLQNWRTVALMILLTGAATSRTLAQEFEVDGIWYSILSENKVKVIQNPDNSIYSHLEVVLPETVAYEGTEYSVTEIGNAAFFTCADLTSITIPKSVTNVASKAFYECSSLKYVNIADGNIPLSFADNYQFYTSPLDSAYIGRELEYGSSSRYGGKSPFSGITTQHTPIKKVEFGDSVRVVGRSLFSNSDALESVIFGENVTDILSSSFASCTSLKTIVFPASITQIANAFNGCKISTVICLGETPPTLSARISTPSPTLFVPEGCLEAYKNDNMWGNEKYFAKIIDAAYVPDFMVDGIKYSMKGKGEVGVVAINDTTKYEGDIILPETISYNSNTYTLTTICTGAFNQCYNLIHVSIPATVNTIDKEAFVNGSPNIECLAMTPPTCANSSFRNVSGKAYIPEGTLDLYQSATGWSNFDYIIESAYIPDFTVDGIIYTLLGKNNVGVVASELQNVKHLVLPETVEYKGMDYKLTEICAKAFSTNPVLYSIVIPNNVTTIREQAFEYCYNLKKVTIPESITSIENGVFYQSNIDTMIVKNTTPPSVENYHALGNRYRYNGVLTVPTGTLQAYMNALHWQDFFKIEEVGGYSNVFEADSVSYKIQSIDIATVTVVGASGRNITIPDSVVFYDKKYAVTAIADEAFSLNSILESVVISEGVTTLGNRAFYNCENLRSIYIPSTLEKGNFSYNYNYINNEYAFLGCTGLEKITVADGHPFLDSRNDCNALIYKLNGGGVELMMGCKNTVIPDGVTQIAPWAFYQTGVEKIIIPNSVTKIGEGAFNSCYNLTSLHIGSGLTEFAIYNNPNTGLAENLHNAIANCIRLDTIVIDDNNPLLDSRNNCNAIIETATNTILLGSNKTKIPEDVTAVETGAFISCYYMESLNVPANLTSIPFGAFSGCRNLKSIVVDKNNTVYDSRNNCNAVIETATDILIHGCMNTMIPEDVVCIGHYAFYQCLGLEEIVIPDAVHTIGNEVFAGCNHLRTITLGNGLKSIGNYPFGNNNYYGRPTTTINTIVFKSAVPPAVKDLYSLGFNNILQSYIRLLVPEGSLSAYRSADIWKDFTNIIESEGVIEFECDGICYSVIIGNDSATVTRRIDKESIDATSTYSDSIVIPETVWYDNKEYVVNAIGEYAFYDCRLSYLSIPATVKKIGYDGLSAFFDGNVTCYATIPPEWLDCTQFGCNYNTILRIPEESIELYRNAMFWENFWRYNANIEAIEDITGIQNVEVNTPHMQTDAVYDLSGRRITNIENLKAGIYIINGKKVYIK